MEEHKTKYMVNSTLLLFSLVYVGFLLAIGISLFTIERPLSGVIFSLLSLPFLVMTFRYGSVVRFDDEKLELYFLFWKRREMKWSDVKEVTVAGSKVLNRNNPKKCGTIYMVFSSEEMDDEERFQMMFAWPPKDKIYIKFTKELLYSIQWHYSKPVARYNIGMLDI